MATSFENEDFLRRELWGKALKEHLIDSLFSEGMAMKYGVSEKILPAVSLKEALVVAAIATVIKNPETTRRHLFNIFRMSDE